MEITKAIEVHQSLLDGTYDHRDETMEDALKLGIEALKCITLQRQQMCLPGPPLLPGETKE